MSWRRHVVEALDFTRLVRLPAGVGTGQRTQQYNSVESIAAVVSATLSRPWTSRASSGFLWTTKRGGQKAEQSQ